MQIPSLEAQLNNPNQFPHDAPPLRPGIYEGVCIQEWIRRALYKPDVSYKQLRLRLDNGRVCTAMPRDPFYTYKGHRVTVTVEDANTFYKARQHSYPIPEGMRFYRAYLGKWDDRGAY